MNPYLNNSLTSNRPFIQNIALPFSQSILQDIQIVCNKAADFFVTHIRTTSKELTCVLTYRYCDTAQTGQSQQSQHILGQFTITTENRYQRIAIKNTTDNFYCFGYIIIGQLTKQFIWDGKIKIDPRQIISTQTLAQGYTQFILDDVSYPLTQTFCLTAQNYLQTSAETYIYLKNTVQFPGYSLGALETLNKDITVSKINNKQTDGHISITLCVQKPITVSVQQTEDIIFVTLNCTQESLKCQ